MPPYSMRKDRCTVMCTDTLRAAMLPQISTASQSKSTSLILSSLSHWCDFSDDLAFAAQAGVTLSGSPTVRNNEDIFWELHEPKLKKNIEFITVYRTIKYPYLSMDRFISNVRIFFVARTLIILASVTFPVTKTHPAKIEFTIKAFWKICWRKYVKLYLSSNLITIYACDCIHRSSLCKCCIWGSP